MYTSRTRHTRATHMPHLCSCIVIPIYKEPCNAYGEARTPIYKEEGGMCMAQIGGKCGRKGVAHALLHLGMLSADVGTFCITPLSHDVMFVGFARRLPRYCRIYLLRNFSLAFWLRLRSSSLSLLSRAAHTFRAYFSPSCENLNEVIKRTLNVYL